VLGVFDGAELVQSWRLQTLRERTSDELGLLVDGLFAHSRIERVQIRGVIIGSVVPPLTGTIRDMAQRYFGVSALIVEPGVNTSMPILYENPAEVGADRIVNGIAAYERFGRSARGRWWLSTSGPRRRWMRLRRKGSTWAARSARACRFRRTRCFSARHGCRASTCGSRLA
jgi:hypothetical protein